MAVHKFGLSVWWKIFAFGILYVMVFKCGIVDGALRDVSLIVEPPIVRRSHYANLHCHFDLDGAPLYSVKFYRGQYEFYRYTPGEHPSSKVFPFPGINVDSTSSNASQVVIRNVQFSLSGNFSCEVTADAPFFSTATAFVNMQVVELPEKRPFIWTDQERYEPGDVLQANCTTPPSRPKAQLQFSINNMVVPGISETQYAITEDNLFASTLTIKIRLQQNHFIVTPSSSATNYVSSILGEQLTSMVGFSSHSSTTSFGSLVLRCLAHIPNFYQETTEIELGGLQKDPVPARVTSSSQSRNQNYLLLQSILAPLMISFYYSIFLARLKRNQIVHS